MKILIVCTNHADYPTKETKTGLWLNELTHFYEVFDKRRIGMDFASPLGGAIPIDARSLDLDDDLNRVHYEDEGFRQKLLTSLSPDQVETDDYQLIYYAGGPGAMWDLTDNAALQAITAKIYERGGSVAAVGHGVCGLLNVMLSDGTRLIHDKYVTGFSNVEEKLASFVSEVPFYLEDRLREYGAHYTKSMIPFVQNIEVDERLVTGQNPNSAGKVARKIMEEISEK